MIHTIGLRHLQRQTDLIEQQQQQQSSHFKDLAVRALAFFFLYFVCTNGLANLGDIYVK